jgi:hypothetical protein
MNMIKLEPNSFYPEHGGFFSGTICIADALFGVITAPKAHGQYSGIWLPSYADVPGATSCFDSKANTIAMAEAGSPIAQQALATTIHGFSDWVIPARDVLEVQYRAHKPTTGPNYVYRSGDNPSSVPAGYPYTKVFPAQCPDPLFQEGGTEAFDAAWHWSSTQCSPNGAWGQTFDGGYQNYSNYKLNEGVVRLVRLIQLTA